MSRFVLYAIKKAGMPDTYTFEDRESADAAWTRLWPQIGQHGVIGIGLEMISQDGTLRPIQSSWSEEGDLFVKRALQFRRKWNRRA